MNSNLYSNEQIIIALILTVLLIGIIISFLMWLKTFYEKREYIKSEMEYAVGEERLYWKKKLRRLYLRSIPVFGRFFE